MKMPKRLPRQNYMIVLGRWVAEQAALGRLAWGEVAEAYDKSGGGEYWPSNEAQVSKLRVFWRYGQKDGAKAVLWLAQWKPHRTGNLSTYDTLLRER